MIWDLIGECTLDPHGREAQCLSLLQSRLHSDGHVQTAHLQGARHRGPQGNGHEAIHRQHRHKRRVRSQPRQRQALRLQGKKTEVSSSSIKYKQAS